MPKCVECKNYLDGTKCKISGHSALRPDEEFPCGEFLTKTQPTRTFDTGATRDTVEDKLSYVKALSPLVLRRYVQYLGQHRKQSGGVLRDWDNWKQGIPIAIYLDSLGRHFIDAWLLIEGYSAEDNHGPVNLEDVLCAIIFNASGCLHEILAEGKDV